MLVISVIKLKGFKISGTMAKSLENFISSLVKMGMLDFATLNVTGNYCRKLGKHYMKT